MASDRQRHVRGVYRSLYGFENYHLSFLVRAESGQICGTWLVWYTNVRVSRVGWSTVPGCTRWTTILPSLDITSSMWCWWFFSCCTSTGLSSYPEWFTSSSSARCVFPSVVVFTNLRKWAHTYGSPSPTVTHLYSAAGRWWQEWWRRGGQWPAQRQKTESPKWLWDPRPG